jgi:hypothetical protein
MKKQHLNILCLLLLVLMPHVCYSGDLEQLQADWTLNQITPPNSAGFMDRFGGDPYIVFPPMEATNYEVKGVQLEIAFTPMLDKPFLMELFWRPDYEGFSEHRKVFFVLLPDKTGNTLKFFIPLSNQEGYKQFRLDFPRDLRASFRVKRFEIITDQQRAEDVERIEPFYKLTATETRTPEIIIPYIIHGIQHGLSRLPKDPAFLIVWLLLIFTALVGTRIVSRSIRKQEGEESGK